MNENRKISLELLARKTGCTVSNVKSQFLNDLVNENVSIILAQRLLIEFRQNKHNESIQLEINPNDTPASYLEEWILEYIESIKPVLNDQDKEKYIDLVKKMLKEDPELQKNLMDHLMLMEDPAEFYLNEAIELFVRKKDYYEAINSIEKVLNMNDIEKNPYLYRLRAECYAEIGQIDKAIIDYEIAIKSLLEIEPENFDFLCRCYSSIFDLYFKLEDWIKAELYINQALLISDNLISAVYKFKYFEKRSNLYKKLGRIELANNDLELSKKFRIKWKSEIPEDDLPF